MRLAHRFMLVLFFVAPAVGAQPSSATRDSLVVSTQWLSQHLKDPDLVVLFVGADDEYNKEHIPGSYNLQSEDVAIDDNTPGSLSLQLLPPERLRATLGTFGITQRSRIVVYAGAHFQEWATRVIMTLDYAGLGGRTSLLDGGSPAWRTAGLPLTDVVPAKRTSILGALAVKPIVVNAEFVGAHIGKPGFSIVDARAGTFYEGVSAGGPRTAPHRAGHIASAKSIPYVEPYNENFVKPTAELQAIFAKAGVAPGDTVIGYCHIGLQATAMLFAARVLGHPIRFYDGSFEDWSRQPATSFPVEVTAPRKP